MTNRYIPSKINGEQQLITESSRSVFYDDMIFLFTGDIHEAMEDKECNNDKNSQ